MPVYTQKEGSGSGSGSNPQTPSGTIDGSNKIFTFTGALNNLFLNEGFQTPNVDYTVSGTTITFTIAPVPGSVIYMT